MGEIRWRIVAIVPAIFLLTGGLSYCPLSEPAHLKANNKYVATHGKKSAIVEATSTNNPASGDVLIMGGAATSQASEPLVEFFDPATKKFASAGFQGGTAGFTAVEFASPPLAGKILLAAGLSGTASFSTQGVVTFNTAVPTSAQLYNYSAGSLTTTGSLIDGRSFATTTLLQNGKVLITGGFDKNGNPLASAELYDPSTGTVSLTGTMVSPRGMHTATLLSDGTALLVGGVNDTKGDTVGTAEIYAPTPGRFTSTHGKLPEGLAAHTATMLLTGKVLIAGGFNFNAPYKFDNSVAAAALYDPTTQQFNLPAGFPVTARAMHTATLLNDGTVLLAGGLSGTEVRKQEGATFELVGADQGGVLNSAEIYDPASSKFTCVGGGTSNCKGSMANARAGHSATIFASGAVLLAGGLGAKTSTVNKKVAPLPLATAELYDPSNGKFTAMANMNSQHAFHSALLLR